MLEVIVVYYLCKRNSENAKARGKKGGSAVAYTICLWIGFEVIGAFLGAFLSAIIGMEGVYGIYMLALVFAGIGALISNLISKSGQVIVQPIVPYPPQPYPPQMNMPPYPPTPSNSVQSNNPYQCRMCGNINPSDSLFCMACGAPLQVNPVSQQQSN